MEQRVRLVPSKQMSQIMRGIFWNFESLNSNNEQHIVTPTTWSWSSKLGAALPGHNEFLCPLCLKIPELSLGAAGDDWRRPRLSCPDNNTDTLWTLLFLAPNQNPAPIMDPVCGAIVRMSVCHVCPSDSPELFIIGSFNFSQGFPSSPGQPSDYSWMSSLRADAKGLLTKSYIYFVFLEHCCSFQ